jgi:hypothetical protein
MKFIMPSRTRATGPGSAAALKGIGEMAVYCPAVINRPRWPWLAPPALEGMLIKLALRRFASLPCPFK